MVACVYAGCVDPVGFTCFIHSYCSVILITASFVISVILFLNDPCSIYRDLCDVCLFAVCELDSSDTVYNFAFSITGYWVYSLERIAVLVEQSDCELELLALVTGLALYSLGDLQFVGCICVGECCQLFSLSSV